MFESWKLNREVQAARKALSDADDVYYHEMPTDGHRQYELISKYEHALDDLCEAVSQSGAPAGEPPADTAWLIEFAPRGTSLPHYWVGEGAWQGGEKGSHAAIRFSRREDAEKLVPFCQRSVSPLDGPVQAVEHSWGVYLSSRYSPTPATHEAVREYYGLATGCHSQKDGDCEWEHCPQLRDNEPAKSGRHCPLDSASRSSGEDTARITRALDDLLVELVPHLTPAIGKVLNELTEAIAAARGKDG